MAGNAWGEEAAGDERAWLRGRLRTRNGCGWGEEAAGDQRAWLRGRLRTGNGCGELRGRLRTAWVQRSGWKWVGRRSRWRSASLAARTAADVKWVRRIARTAADGVGATEWLEMGGEKQPMVMSELGCGELRGRLRTAWVQRSGWKWVARRRRQMGGENCVDGCGRRGCQGVAGNGWGEEAAGDERAWLRGRLRTGNGCGELRGRLRTAWVPGNGWKWVGRRSRWRSAGLAARTAADVKWVWRIARTAADGVGAREWLEMGGEKKPLVMGELGCADGYGREIGVENCADGCGWRGCKGVAGNGWGEEAAGDERAWLRGRLRK